MIKDEQIVNLIKKPYNKDKIAKCVQLEKDLKKYLDGLGYKNPIQESDLDFWESDAKKDLIQHLKTPPTLPISKLIRDELNKGIKTDTSVQTFSKNEEKVNGITSQIWKDNNLKFFINSFLKKSIDTDFCSFLVVTKGKLIDIDGVKYEVRDGSIKKNEGNFLPYVIYISIADVVDFKTTGKETDYLIYKFEKRVIGKQEYQVYRFIDTERDLLLIEKDNVIEPIEGSEIFHKVGYTPAKQLSSLYLISSLIPEIKGSQFSHVVGEFASYEIQFKELKMSEVRHAFPKYYSIGFKCPVCDGQGQILNPDYDPDQSRLYHYHDATKRIGESITCPYCKGEKTIASIDSKEVMKLPAAINTDGQVLNLNQPAGFIQFPAESLEYQDTKLKDLEFKIIFDCTGNKNIVVSRLQTATEVDTNTRSLEFRIQERQKIIEAIIDFSVNTACKMAGIECEYSYQFQRNISYKSVETLYAEIDSAVKSGLPKEYIDELKKELTQIRFNQPEIVESINNSIENERTETTDQSVSDS